MTADTEIGGVEVRALDYLVMLYASGNRDEAAFGPTADTFDIRRDSNPPHLAFGFGAHLYDDLTAFCELTGIKAIAL